MAIASLCFATHGRTYTCVRARALHGRCHPHDVNGRMWYQRAVQVLLANGVALLTISPSTPGLMSHATPWAVEGWYCDS